MAQHDYNIANQTGANFRTYLNNALSAIVSNNSGSSEPSTMYAYEWWIDTSNNVLKLRNSANNAWITMPFSITADNTIDINAGTVNGITSLSFSSGATVTSILDEDNLGSDSATALATQQSIKAYVDSQVTAQDLDISDGSSTIAIDLDSETLSLLGGTGVTSAASGNGVTFSIGQSVGTSDNVVFNQVTGALVGNASTATALATARTISGVSFDGTANITLDTDDIGEGTTNKYFTAERVDDQVNTLLTAGANISLTYDDAAGTLTIANTNSADITSVVAGDGLTGGGTSGDVTLAVGVDDSSIEISSDALRVKATGITNAMLAGSIANAKLANSSITVNSQAIALGGSHTFDTDDIGEGSSNLYYTDARANSAIDTRVTNTFINNLSGVVADTATALATGRTIALSGDVTASGVSFDGTGNITLSTTIAANSVALGTDTTGNYVSTISGTTNEIEVSGSGSETATVTIGLPDDVTIAGNLTVNGTTTTVNSDTLSVTDPLIKLAKANSGADSLDIGFYGLYDTSGSQDLYAGLFRDANDSGKFKLFKDLQVEPTTTVNTSGTGYAVGTLVSNLEGNVTGNVTGTVSSISNHSTSDLSEGTNLYYTDARFDTRLGTKTTDNLTEGSSNLYMTTERVQDIVGGMVTGNTETGITVTYDDSDGTLDFVVGTLNQDTTGNAATATALETARTIGGVSFDGTGNIDLAGVNTTGNQDTSGNAATATALATGRTIGMTGDVVWTSASFDGSGNVTGTATIQANSVALGTDTTGDYVSTITAGTGLTSTGATSGEGVAHSLSVDAAQTQITSVGTLTSLTVDDITLDGSTISDGGDLTIDVAGDIILDADGDGEIFLKDGGTSYGLFYNSNSNFMIYSANQDNDMYFQGNDGGSTVNALILDMSEAGAATFNSDVTATGIKGIESNNGDPILGHFYNANSGTAAEAVVYITNSSTVSDGLFLETTGTSFTTASGFVQDAGVIGTGTGASGGLSIMTRANADMRFYTNGHTNERMRIDSAGAIQIGGTTNAGFVDFDSVSLQLNTQRNPNTGSFVNTAKSHASIALRGADGGSEIRFGTASANNTTSSERMRIDSSGNVGIGESSPDAPLHITSNTPIIVFDESDASQEFRLGSFGGVFALYDQTDSAFRVAVDGSGNVGIGTTSPQSGLHIAEGGSGSDGGSVLTLSQTGFGTIVNNDDLGSVHFGGVTGGGVGIHNAAKIMVEGDATWASNDYPTRMSFFTTADGASSATEKMRINSTGQVLVTPLGVSTPSFAFTNDTNTGMTRPTGDTLQFVTGGSERVRIASDGDFYINTSVVQGQGGCTFQVGSRGINQTFNQSSHVDGNEFITFRNTNTQIGSISAPTSSSVAYNTSSDARLKNVTGKARGLEVINKLNPVSFNWKADNKADEGLLAQEVLDIVPNAVSGSEEDMYQMDYSKLVTPLIAAIQEQQEQIDALQSEILQLKGE